MKQTTDVRRCQLESPGRRRSTGRYLIAGAIFLLQSLGGPGHVEAAGEGGPWQAEWEKAVKAAEGEGVTVYAITPVGDLQVIWDAFRKRFPKIKLTTVVPGRGSELIPRVMAERRAEKFLADVVLAAPTTIYRSFYQARILEAIPPALILPEVKDLSKWWHSKHHYVDREGQYIFMYEGTLYGPQIAYNTKLVNPQEMKSVWDALHPKWLGRFAAFDIVGTGQAGSTGLILLYYHPQIGPHFIEKLYGEMNTILYRDFRQGTDWLATGKFALCFLCRDVQRAGEQGLPVAELDPYQLKEKPGLGAGNGALSLLNRAPHPHAAKVFINWYLSQGGQIAFRLANTDNDRKTSLREDLPLKIVPEPARRMKDREYVFINRPDWMDFTPIHALIEKTGQKKK